ncbi:hypothetical protein BOTBODRAFT_216929 [Botryobasidium botryosum FD-172 SS1]|uniref:Uncharacterized protein n=1 Tax=Botryobasidium botryosum (strain FD-172 SS1) TaxID=930990 RepID=A0A067N4M8_BOTB1|nr:hypothetical protein BOTBODRAFT_216929 [Botryobasidium botryosum FD-172 SS1]
MEQMASPAGASTSSLSLPPASGVLGRRRQSWGLRRDMSRFMFEKRRKSRFQHTRGIAVVIFILFLMWYASQQIGVKVFRQSFNPVAQLSYSRSLSSDQLLAAEVDRISVFVGVRASLLPKDPGFSLASAINVTALWSDKIADVYRQECEFAYEFPPNSTLAQVGFACPFAWSGAAPACGSRVYDPCIPNILVTFNYDQAQIAPQAIPDVFHSALMWTTFTFEDLDVVSIQDATPPITLMRNVHLIGTVRRYLRIMFRTSGHFWAGLFSDPDQFTIAETTILGANPYDFIPRTNNTASLYILQEYDSSDFRTVTDTQTDTILGGLSSVGGILSIGEKVLSILFGLSLIALLDLEGFSLFSPGERATEEDSDSGDDSRRAGQEDLNEGTRGENAVLLMSSRSDVDIKEKAQI